MLEPSPIHSAIIELKNVKRYFTSGKETVRAIDNVDFTVNCGEFITVTGPSGSGKSTLLNLIGLLDSPTGGEIRIQGDDIQKLTQREKSAIRMREIGFIFQFFNLQKNLTALENVMIPFWFNEHTRKESEERASELLQKVGLQHRVDHLPSELSGGQQQRVAIARALVNSPSVILADEPTGNLDSQTTKEIITLFEDLNRSGETIILVTHEKNLTECAGRSIELVDGRIVSDQRRE